MKILILGNINSDYITSFTKHLRGAMPEIDCVDLLSKPLPVSSSRQLGFDRCSFIDAVCPKVPFPVRIKTLFAVKRLGKDYDLVLIHYLYLRYLFILNELKKRCKHIVSVVWGSDFLQASAKNRNKLKALFNASSGVVATRHNQQMVQELADYYQLKPEKMFGCSFGSNILDFQKSMRNTSSLQSKQHLNLDAQKKTITIGYNRNPIHQHLDIIKMLANLPSQWNGKIELVFPLTYGEQGAYVEKIKEEVLNLPYSCVFLEQFLSVKEVFHLRNATDIFILLQKTDANSNTIVEHLFANNIVISGDWLPYAYLKEEHVFFHAIRSIPDLNEQLQSCLLNFDLEKDKVKENHNHIAQLKSWEYLIPEWVEMIRTITKE